MGIHGVWGKHVTQVGPRLLTPNVRHNMMSTALFIPNYTVFLELFFFKNCFSFETWRQYSRTWESLEKMGRWLSAWNFVFTKRVMQLTRRTVMCVMLLEHSTIPQIFHLGCPHVHEIHDWLHSGCGGEAVKREILARVKDGVTGGVLHRFRFYPDSPGQLLWLMMMLLLPVVCCDRAPYSVLSSTTFSC